MSCQVNAVADAPDEDQGVVGAVFNVAIQLGGPIGLAISTILSQVYEPAVGAEGAALMSGNRAAFYTFGVIGGVGWILSLLLASNRDPIEFSSVAPEKEEGDVQEKGLEVVDESQISGVEGKAELEEDDVEKRDEKKGGSSISIAKTVIA